MVWTIRSCVMADLFFSLSPTVLLGIFRENLLGLPLWRYDTRVSDPWLPQEMWFRPLLGGGCVNSTDWAEQTDDETRTTPMGIEPETFQL